MRTRVSLAASTAVVMLVGSFAAGVNPPAAKADTPVKVSVTARGGLATQPATGLGVNDAVWDGALGSTSTADLLKAAGVGMVRYPGGSYGDIYHWRDNTAPGGYVAPNTDFDTFMASVQRIGAQPMIIANYGTGTPQEAADWVRYANVTKGYGAKYWSIGNEVYGNGHYGADWEVDNHTDKSPTAYANGVVAFADAMKAVDPTIKVGAVLTIPGDWPDGLVGSGDSGTWNQTVLRIAGSKIDFVDVHWYPGGSMAAEALTKPQQIEDATYLLRQQIKQNAGVNADRIGISLTETNVGVGEDTQPAAMFLADTYSRLLEYGVFTVNWWNVHNDIGTVSTVAGQTDYGDGGMLSSAGCTSDGKVCEPPFNTPFAPFYGLSMMSVFAHPGDQFLSAGTDDPLVVAHAVRRPDGDLAVLLVNEDPTNSHAVGIDYTGYVPASAAPTVYSFQNGGTSVVASQTGTATSQTLPPYSLTTLVLHPASAGADAPGVPGRPTLENVTDRSAVVSWPAAQAGDQPAVKYEVYRQNGATSEELGETPGTSLTMDNLNPGTRYTINVLSRDAAGNVSWASPPLTFTTGSPATSTCTVKLTDTNDWGNGYIGNIDITNTGAAPIDGWTLTYTWPTGWQQVSSGWNATWEQTSQDVKATSVDGNRSLAANGGTTSIGFVGGYNGPNLLPSVFTLNGTVCHTA